MANENDGVELRITAKNLTAEAFARVSEALRKLEDDSERTSRKGKDSWGSWFTTITGGVAVGGLLTAAFSKAGTVLASIPGQLIELGQRGADVNDVEGAFRSLNAAIGETADDSLAKMRAAMGGTVSDFDLMKSANEGLQRGLKLTGDDFATMAKGARIAADAVGGDAKETWDAMIKAIATGQERTLKGLPLDFAAISRSVEEHARSLGVDAGQLSQHEKSIAIRNAVLKESARLLAENGEIENDFADKVAAGKAMIDNWTDALGQSIAKSPALNSFLTSAATGLQNAFGSDRQAQVQSMTGYVNTAVISVGKFGVIALDTAGYVSQAWDVVKTVFYATATVLGGAITMVGGFVGGLAEMASRLPGVGDTFKGLSEGVAAFNAKTWESTKGFAELTKESAKGVVGQGAYYDALTKTRDTLSASVDKMALAASQQVKLDEATGNAGTRLRTDYGPAVEGADSKTLKLSQSLGDLARDIDAARARGVDASEMIRLFGDKALKAADDAKRAGLTVKESIDEVATAAQQLENRQYLQKMAIEINETGRKIYDDLVARKAKEQDAEFAHLAKLLEANRTYRDDLALLAKTGADREIEAIERARQAELEALPQRTAVNARFYDERVAQINAHYDYERRIALGTADTIAERMRALGVVTRRELQESAAAATRDYGQMLASGLYTADQIEQAWIRMMQANAEALGGWRGAVLDVLTEMPGRFAATFADIITKKVTFRDGMKSIMLGIRDDFASVLDDMLRQFLQGFLARMLSGLLGMRPQFASAWSSVLMPGGAGGGMGVPGMPGIPGLPGWLGGAANGGGIPGVTGSYTVAGLPGAAGVPWWSTALGGGAIGGAAGAGAGWVVGSQTGNTWGGAGAGAGTGFGVGMMFGGPVGGLIGGLIGGGVGWYAAKRENKKTNDVRDQFFLDYAQQRGEAYEGGTHVGSTYHDVAARLTEAGAGAGGGQLFKNLIEANDRDALVKAIAAVEQALAAYEARLKSTAATQDAAAAQATDLATSMQGIRDQMRPDELKALSDAYEKALTEGFIGSLDEFQQQQLRFYQVLKEGDARMKTWFYGETISAFNAIESVGESAAAVLKESYDDTFDAIREGARQAGRSISEYLAQRKAAYEFEHPDAPRALEVNGIPAYPMAEGGIGRVSKPTVFIAGEKGPEDFAFSGANRAFPVHASGGSIDYGAVQQAVAAGVLLALTGAGLAGLGTGPGLQAAVNQHVWGDYPRAMKDNVGNMRDSTEGVALAVVRR